jgi:glycosyltransferase 2 family protein
MRRILLSAAKILVSAALLYFALRNTNFSELGARINLESLGWLTLALAVAVLQIVIQALRWREISAGCGAPLKVMQAARYNMIGAFFNQTLPSAIGGDAMRLWLLARAGAGWRAATYSVFVDRAIGLIALAALILFAMPWSLDLIGNAEGRLGLVLLDLAALGAGAAFLLLHLLPFELLTRIWATRHFYACSKVASRILFGRRSGPLVIAISILVHVMAVVIAWCVTRAIAAPADFLQLLQLIPPVMLITMIPVSIAGWGLREAGMGLAFSYAGIGSSEGVAVSLLFGAVYFVLGGFGGLVWIVSAEKAAQGSAPIEVPE